MFLRYNYSKDLSSNKHFLGLLKLVIKIFYSTNFSVFLS
ncbi:hypothetical protein J2Y60_000434 [Arcicella sp. BE140]|nr:hypothetical protein [Arcicella sp. BE51]MDR6810253.1 hypothetical protein [Arcicella sp. BE140]MDR6821603.1 hypothetical protein [Arcicella sp. BE139]